MSSSVDHVGNNHPENSGLFKSLENSRLLVVDDEENLRITTAAILEKEGYEVDTASSGNEAIALLANSDYDLVLTDLHMEAGEGLAVLDRKSTRLNSSHGYISYAVF